MLWVEDFCFCTCCSIRLTLLFTYLPSDEIVVVRSSLLPRLHSGLCFVRSAFTADTWAHFVATAEPGLSLGLSCNLSSDAMLRTSTFTLT